MIQTVDPSPDTMLEVLGDRYRRRVLVTLLDHERQNAEIAPVPPDISAEELSELKLKMRHHHLPKLEEADLIMWDRETNDVRKGPRFDEIRPLVEQISECADELPGAWL